MVVNSTDEAIRLTEFHAAEDVAGSKMLIESGGKRVLQDIGSQYNETRDSQPFPFDAKSIDLLVLSHAHGDHIGQLLRFIKEGFKGPIYSTSPTKDIARTQMIQQVSSVFMYNKWIKGKRFISGPNQGQYIPFKKVEFISEDVQKAIQMFAGENAIGFDYEKTIPFSQNINLTFYEAGHIPGSAQMLYEMRKSSGLVKLLISCDLGRTDYKIAGHPIANTPIVRFPYDKFGKDIDYIVMEATYGDKVHRPLEESLAVQQKAIIDAKQKGGIVVRPTFATMREQMLSFFDFGLLETARIPSDTKFYRSCPSADQIIKVILDYPEYLDEEAYKMIQNQNRNPFKHPNLVNFKTMIETLAALPNLAPGSVVTASSGMGDYGRIVTIFKNTISNPKNIVLGTGHCSPGTKVWMMEQGYKKIPFDDGEVEMNAEYRRMGGLSGHNDCIEGIAHLKSMRNPDRREQFRGIFIKHGEKSSCEGFKNRLITAGYDPATIHVMKKGETYVLN